MSVQDLTAALEAEKAAHRKTAERLEAAHLRVAQWVIAFESPSVEQAQAERAAVLAMRDELQREVVEMRVRCRGLEQAEKLLQESVAELQRSLELVQVERNEFDALAARVSADNAALRRLVEAEGEAKERANTEIARLQREHAEFVEVNTRAPATKDAEPKPIPPTKNDPRPDI